MTHVKNAIGGAAAAFLLIACAGVQPVIIDTRDMGAPSDASASALDANTALDASAAGDANTALDAGADMAMAESDADVVDAQNTADASSTRRACATNFECRGWVPTDLRDESCGPVACIDDFCAVDLTFAVSCSMDSTCNYSTGICEF